MRKLFFEIFIVKIFVANKDILIAKFYLFYKIVLHEFYYIFRRRSYGYIFITDIPYDFYIHHEFLSYYSIPYSLLLSGKIKLRDWNHFYICIAKILFILYLHITKNNPMQSLL